MCFFLLAARRVDWRLALPGAAGLGVGATYWSQALISEVYAFDALLLSATLLLAVRAREADTRRSCALLAAVCGLWLSHRNVNLIYLPAALILAWPALAPRLRSARELALLGASFALPVAAVVVYLPVASAVYPYKSWMESFSTRGNNDLSLMGKLSWNPSRKKKLSASYNHSVQVNQGYYSGSGFPYSYIGLLDNYPTRTQESQVVNLQWIHTLNPTLFYNLNYGYFYTGNHRAVQNKHWSDSACRA